MILTVFKDAKQALQDAERRYEIKYPITTHSHSSPWPLGICSSCISPKVTSRISTQGVTAQAVIVPPSSATMTAKSTANPEDARNTEPTPSSASSSFWIL